MDDITEIKVVTQNLDARDISVEERLKYFLEEIKRINPHVVMIQEGTNLTYERLFREMGYMGFKKNVPEAMRKRKIGEIIFSRLPIVKFEYSQFQYTDQLRGVTRALIDVGGSNIWFVTTQFEKGIRSVPMRKKQIFLLTSLFRDDSNIIFGGDTGILEYQSTSQPEGWYDAWYEAGDEKSRHTVDCNKNILVNPPDRDRMDRIWYRLSIADKVSMECEECGLIGDERDSPISSHFGVLATFKLNRIDVNKNEIG